MLNISVGIWLWSFSRGWRWFCGLSFLDLVAVWGILLELLLVHVLSMFLGPVDLLSLHVSSSWVVLMVMGVTVSFLSDCGGIIISSWSISLEILLIHLFSTLIIPIRVRVELLDLMFL